MSFNTFSPRSAMGAYIHQEYPSVGIPQIMRRKSGGGGPARVLSGQHQGTVMTPEIGARRIGDRLMTGGETEGRTLPARNEMCGCGRTKLSRYNRSIECFLCQEERAGSAVHR